MDSCYIILHIFPLVYVAACGGELSIGISQITQGKACKQIEFCLNFNQATECFEQCGTSINNFYAIALEMALCDCCYFSLSAYSRGSRKYYSRIR